jgi:uncharacterized protein (TIGR00297 family)
MSQAAFQLLIGGGLAISVAILARGTKLLSTSGALAAALIGFAVFGIGGLGVEERAFETFRWADKLGIAFKNGLVFGGPLLAFFFSSSILSRIGRARKASQQTHYDKTSTRDAGQVLANGGLAGILAIVYSRNADWLPPRQDMLLYLGALAAVNADTWATEIGGLWQGRPFLVTNFRKVEPGVSGAVSLLGLAASLAGAFFVEGAGYLAWPARSELLLWKPDAAEILAIGWAGFVAAFGDSILGASIQAQYKCAACGSLTERRIHCGGPAILTRGHPWITNDVVNFLTSLMGIIFTSLLLSMFANPR